MTASAGRYPMSAQCGIPGAPRPACCSMRGRAGKPKRPDPLAPEAVLAHGANRRACGARRTKAALERRGPCASGRRIGRITRGSGPVGAYPRARLKARAGRPGEAGLPDVVAREFDGRAPRTRIVSDPACVRVGSKRNHACLLVDLRNREIAGHAAGGRKDASLVKPAFAAAALPLAGIQAFHADGGGESGSIAIDDLLGAFGIEGSPSGKGCPCGSAVDEPASKMPKAESVYGESVSTLHGLQVELNDHVRWHSRFRLHSKLGYVSPVEFGNAGLSP